MGANLTVDEVSPIDTLGGDSRLSGAERGGGKDEAGGIPGGPVKLSVHPNPFNPRTTVSFALDRPGHVELSIHDLTGRRVAVLVDRLLPAGTYPITWTGTDANGRAAASGVYVAHLTAGSAAVISRKMMLIR